MKVDVSQLVGFLMMLLFILLPAIRQALQERARKKDPEGSSQQERNRRERLREIFETLDVPEERESLSVPKAPPPPSQVKAPPLSRKTLTSGYEFHSKVEDRHPVSSIEQRSLHSSLDERYQGGLVSERFRGNSVARAQRRDPRSAKVHRLLRKSSKEQFVVLHALLSPPKSMEHEKR